jgi:hypothetical protein
MQSHLSTENFPALWEKIQKWVKTDNQAEHDQIWNEIKNDPTVLLSVLEYLKENWEPVSHMWATVAQKDWSIFEKGETNMLIEVYVMFLLLSDKIKLNWCDLDIIIN